MRLDRYTHFTQLSTSKCFKRALSLDSPFTGMEFLLFQSRSCISHFVSQNSVMNDGTRLELVEAFNSWLQNQL
jgi:hypothetical protein